MNPRAYNQRSAARAAGFSLIELIGVMAIMAILAAVLVPNTLKSIDRAAIDAEHTSLDNLGTTLKLYLREKGILPTPSSWTTDLATYSDIPAADIATNKRQNARSYIRENPSGTSSRVLILSSMRAGLDLPTEATLSSGGFDRIWTTADNALPPTSSWSGWSNWNAVAGSAEYLVIERVNLASIYAEDLATYTVSLNNTSANAANYKITPADGSAQKSGPVAANASASITGLKKGDRLDLYRGTTATTPLYTFVVADGGRTFDFDGTNWLSR